LTFKLYQSFIDIAKVRKRTHLLSTLIIDIALYATKTLYLRKLYCCQKLVQPNLHSNQGFFQALFCYQ